MSKVLHVGWNSPLWRHATSGWTWFQTDHESEEERNCESKIDWEQSESANNSIRLITEVEMQFENLFILIF
jgi:hypothetical protein